MPSALGLVRFHLCLGLHLLPLRLVPFKSFENSGEFHGFQNFTGSDMPSALGLVNHGP